MRLRNIVFAVFLCLWAQAVRAEENVLKGYQFGGWNADFGIEERLRYEYKTNFDFNNNLDDDGSLFFNRLRVNGRFISNDAYEIFIEGLDARVGSQDIKKTNQADDLDLYQAYIKMNNLFDADFSCKLGRQQLNYGKGRLLAAPTWSNRMSSFDAAVLRYTQLPLSIDAIVGRIVKYDDHNPNHVNDEEMVNGIYIGYRQDKDSPLFEVYSLNQIDNSTQHLYRYTVGIRGQSQLWDGATGEVEIPYQFGETGDKDIKAYAFHFDLQQKFEMEWNPKLTVEVNLASGDDNASDNESNTFVPLYQSTHAPYGIMDLFKWQNMREFAAGVAVTPADKLQLTGGMNFFWLDNTRDAWVNSSGTTVKSATTSDVDSFVGTEVSLVGKYELTKEFQVEAGYAHFFTGTYIEDRGAHDDADWLYMQSILKF
ncbi:MAG: alginate export family protein [Candidatus Omnitrophica bacterium]|nr:alginate export family protein [Candidatus Omnitrophota bacterium]